jgi:hypothetical protein
MISGVAKKNIGNMEEYKMELAERMKLRNVNPEL